MRLFEILKYLDIPHSSYQDFEILSLCELQEAKEGDIVYVDQEKYLPFLQECRASAVFIRPIFVHQVPPHIQAIAVEDPQLCFAYLSSFFSKEIFEQEGQDAQISPEAKVMQGVYLGKNVVIKSNALIMPGVVIGDNVVIGEGCKIYPNVVIYADTLIGDRVFIHAGSVIGSDGFGYAHTKDGRHIKIYHHGRVVIEDDVEIGANCTIDRAVFGQTRIKQGSKIDNLVQIGHNCIIGEHTILVSQVGLAGSTSTGRNVVMGGQSGSGGHIHIGDFTQIAGRGAVGKNLPPHTKWGGHPLMELDEWMKFYVGLKRLLKNKR